MKFPLSSTKHSLFSFTNNCHPCFQPKLKVCSVSWARTKYKLSVRLVTGHSTAPKCIKETSEVTSVLFYRTFELGLVCGYLLHGMLAAAALHLAYLQPGNQAKHNILPRQHQHLALAGSRWLGLCRSLRIANRVSLYVNLHLHRTNIPRDVRSKKAVVNEIRYCESHLTYISKIIRPNQ